MGGGMAGGMGGGGAYGAGKAGTDFDPVAFVKKPVTILRISSWIFAIIVFGVASDSYSKSGMPTRTCLYNNDDNACGWSVFVGVFAFLACMILIVGDAMFDNLSSVQTRKYVVMGDLGFSGIWAFFYFVTFCYIASAWSKTPGGPRAEYAGTKPGAIMAFSLFSIATFAGLAYFAYQKYRAGVSEQFATANDFNGPSGMEGGQGGYTPYPGNSGVDPYQPPPFAGPSGGGNTFAAPSY